MNYDRPRSSCSAHPRVRGGADRPVAEELDRESRFPYDIVAELAELGLMGIPIPEEHGGAGGDTVSYALAVEELTRVDLSVAITVAAHTSLGTMPIFLGTEKQKHEWLPDLVAGKRLAAFGLTEPGAGSDAGATRTRAELRDGQWVVNGSKIFITNAGTDITACVTVTARTDDDEISNLIVPNGAGGYEISEPMRKLGWHASDTRELSFTDCAVPEENLLGPRGAGLRSSSRSSTAVGSRSLPWALVSRRARTSWRAMRRSGSSSGSRSRSSSAVPPRRDGDGDRGGPRACPARGVLSDQGPVVEGGRDGEALHGRALGARGRCRTPDPRWVRYMEEYAISRLYRDQKVLEIGEGTNDVQKMVIARHLGLRLPPAA